MATLLELVEQVKVAAEAVAAGDGSGHELELMHAVRNLNRVAEPPADRLRRIAYQPVQNAMIRLAVEMGLPHALVEAKEMTADELASKSGVDKKMIVRVMRLLTELVIVDETGVEKYSANPTTEALASPTWTSGIRFLHDTLAPTYAKVVDYHHDTGFRSTEKTPMSYAVGTDFWTFLNERPSLHQDFLIYMRGRNVGTPRWLDYFPIQTQVGDLSTAKDSVALVDVGGNLGHDLKFFRERCPEIPGRVVLMDLPEVLRSNKDPLDGIEKVEYDFFMPQPVIGAKFYFFRSICHDWPDEACLRFLGNTVKAMKPGYSRLLINEQVLPDTGAELHPVMLDLTMLTYFNAMERTERQWRTLLGTLGVEIVKIWKLKEGRSEAIIETMLKE